MIFILGRGRSGTTLLSYIINKNPEISSSPEGMFVLELYNKYKNIKNWNQIIIENFVNDLLLDARMTPWKINKEDLIHELKKLSKTKDMNYATVCKNVYAFYAKTNNKKENCILIDKNPHYSLCIDKILKIFPESKFIHVVRDHRDNILSYKNVKFDLDDTAALAWRWHFFNKEIEKYKTIYEDQFHFMRYEDLITDPKKELNKLCQFAGVQYSHDMLDFSDNKFGRFFWDKNIVGCLDPKRINKWEKNMKPRDILVTDSICTDLAKKYGYEINTDKTNQTFSNKIDILFKKYIAKMRSNIEKMTFYIPQNLRTRLINHFRKEFYSQNQN